MALASSELNAVYNFDINVVYSAVACAGQGLKYKVTYADPNAHVLKFDVPMSLFSWGEHITVQLYEINGGRTSVIFNSASNLGTEITASSKNKKNIQKLIAAIPQHLNVNLAAR